MYIWYFSREITLHTVIYGANVRFWPTLTINHTKTSLPAGGYCPPSEAQLAPDEPPAAAAAGWRQAEKPLEQQSLRCSCLWTSGVLCVRVCVYVLCA